MAKKTAKKSTKKSAKKGKTATVHIHTDSLAKFKKAAHSAGLAKDFKRAAGKTKKVVFVAVKRKNFDKLKELAGHHDLAAHPSARSLSACDCDPTDPFCICI